MITDDYGAEMGVKKCQKIDYEICKRPLKDRKKHGEKLQLLRQLEHDTCVPLLKMKYKYTDTVQCLQASLIFFSEDSNYSIQNAKVEMLMILTDKGEVKIYSPKLKQTFISSPK